MTDYASVQYGLLERSGMLSSLDYSGTSSNSDRDINFTTEDYTSLQEDSDDDDAFISFTTTESRCEILFQRGLELKIQDDLADALLCFEDCLTGMQDCQYFAKLPQTLLQLHSLHKCLGNGAKAEEYGEAEKLFQEATQPKLSSNSLLNGGSQPRTKRKPFSKKAPSSLSAASSCNPAEYGNLMVTKANEYEQLASLQAEKGNMDSAMESCRNAVILRQCIYGQTVPVVEAAMTMFEFIYGQLEERKGRLSQNIGAVCATECVTANAHGKVLNSKRDLSMSTLDSSHFLETKGFDKREDIVSDSELQSVNCGQPGPNMWSTQETLASSTQWHPQATSSSTQLKTGSLVTVEESSLNDSTHSTMDSTDLGLNHALNYSSITPERDHPPTTSTTTSSPQHQHYENTSTMEDKDSHILDYCGGRVHPHDNGQCWAIPVQPHTTSLHSSQLTHPQYAHSPHHHNNLCKGVTKGVKNLTKLSAELKAPMCVTLDVQTVKTDRGGMEHPRCLPLWVLLLGAFVEMALLAYMLYNH